MIRSLQYIKFQRCAISLCVFYIIHYFFYENLCNYTICFTALHIISSLFIYLNSVDCDVPEPYYIVVIASLYCFIRIYLTFINM